MNQTRRVLALTAALSAASPLSAATNVFFNTPDFTLLQNSNFVPATWSVVTDAVTVVVTNNQALLPAGSGARFFRLVF